MDEIVKKWLKDALREQKKRQKENKNNPDDWDFDRIAVRQATLKKGGRPRKVSEDDVYFAYTCGYFPSIASIASYYQVSQQTIHNRIREMKSSGRIQGPLITPTLKEAIEEGMYEIAIGRKMPKTYQENINNRKKGGKK